MKHRCLQYDNLDDRREIYQLLDRLSPRRRVLFLGSCCRQCTLPHSTVHPQVNAKTVVRAKQAERDSSASSRLSLEVYMDLWMLAMQYNLDLDRVVEQLVALVQGVSRGTL